MNGAICDSKDNWTRQEREIAREAFDSAFGREEAFILQSVRKMAMEAANPHEVWSIHDHLSTRRKEIEEKYDFRYSQIRWVFGRLLVEGWMKWEDLEGISPDKLDEIRMMAEFYAR